LSAGNSRRRPARIKAIVPRVVPQRRAYLPLDRGQYPEPYACCRSAKAITSYLPHTITNLPDLPLERCLCRSWPGLSGISIIPVGVSALAPVIVAITTVVIVAIATVAAANGGTNAAA